jgi:hypothetical protein
MLGNSCVAAQLAASQEGLISMELVGTKIYEAPQAEFSEIRHSVSDQLHHYESCNRTTVISTVWVVLNGQTSLQVNQIQWPGFPRFSSPKLIARGFSSTRPKFVPMLQIKKWKDSRGMW